MPTVGDPETSLETVAKRHRRVFSAAEKLRILKEADECLASGKRGALGALLRREGIYSSLLSAHFAHRDHSVRVIVISAGGA